MDVRLIEKGRMRTPAVIGIQFDIGMSWSGEDQVPELAIGTLGLEPIAEPNRAKTKGDFVGHKVDCSSLQKPPKPATFGYIDS